MVNLNRGLFASLFDDLLQKVDTTDSFGSLSKEPMARARGLMGIHPMKPNMWVSNYLFKRKMSG